MRETFARGSFTGVLLWGAVVAAAVPAGAIELTPPSGWTRSERAGAVIFAAPGQPSGEFALLAVLPVAAAPQWPQAADALWRELKAEHRDVQETKPVDGERNGHAFRLVAGSMADSGGRFLYVTAFAARGDRVMQPVLFIASKAALYERYASNVEQSLDSIRFPRGSAPAPSRAKPPSVAALLQSDAKAQSVNAAVPPPSSANPLAGRTVSLVGTWSTGSVSPVGFYDASTGAWAAPTGSGQSYELRADGTYVYAGLLQTSMYGCTTSVFVYNTGQWRSENGALVFRERTANTRSNDNCNARFNYDKKVAVKTERLPFRVEEDSYGLALVMASEHGELRFYRP